MIETNLAIEYLSVNELKPYDKNARQHSDGDVQAIVNSIRELGFNDPIGVWGKDNLIVEGHGRLLAAKNLVWSLSRASILTIWMINSAERML